jgi:hypothetical protein
MLPNLAARRQDGRNRFGPRIGRSHRFRAVLLVFPCKYESYKYKLPCPGPGPMCGFCPHSGVFCRTPRPAKPAQVLLAEDHRNVRCLGLFVWVRTLPLAAVRFPRRPVAHGPGGPTRADPLAPGAVPARQSRILPDVAPLSREKFVKCLGGVVGWPRAVTRPELPDHPTYRSQADPSVGRPREPIRALLRLAGDR